MLIVITGLDGSGTSSLARNLNKIDKNSVLLKAPSKEYEDSRNGIDDIVRTTSPLAHYLYYLSSVVFISDYIRNNIDYKNNNVYCVRYLIDTVVSHRTLGLSVELDYEKYNIIKPDMTIFVRIDEETRQKRITERGKSILDKTLDEEIFRNKFNKEFERYSSQFVFFDNNRNEIEKNAIKFYDQYIKGEYKNEK